MGWGRWLRRGAAARGGVLVVVAALVAIAEPMRPQAQGSDDLAALQGHVSRLYSQGKYAEAIPVAERYVALARQKHGEEHTEFAPAVAWLAYVYHAQDRYPEAEPLYQRALAITEKALGPDHPDVVSSVYNLARLYYAQGRYAEAEPLSQRALAITEKALGPDHPDVGSSVYNLAVLYRAQGRYADAEQLYKRSLAIHEKALGSDHPNVGTSLEGLAGIYKSQGRYAEAELLYKRSISIREKALGLDHPDVGSSLNNLAALYRAQGRYAEADPLYQRSLTISEKALGADHPSVGTSLNNLAELYRTQGRYAEAEPLFKRSLSITEKVLGADHRHVGTSLSNLAALYESQGRYAEAEPLYKRDLTITEKALGPDHPHVGSSLNNLAGLYSAQGRYAEAEPLFKRSLSITEKALGADHPEVGTSLHNLAALSFLQRDWAVAADYWRRSTGVVLRRAQRGTADVGQALTGKRKGEAEQTNYQFWGLIKAAYRLALEGRGADASLQRSMFQTAQWAQGSEAAVSLVQMAARGAKGDPALAALVRERQDLVEEWQKRDGVRSAAVSQAPDKRDSAAETANVTRLAAIDMRIANIDKRLVADFPDYAALARPVPLSVEEVQAQLGANEALVLFLDTPEWKPTSEETFIWVVTNSGVRWVKSDLGTPALTREVSALRCGLDASAWAIDGSGKCAGLLKAAAPKGDAPLPFDTARAHALYKALLGQVEDLIRDKHLLIVPSGPLTALPFQVLVTAGPGPSAQGGGEYRAAAWVIKRHAITVLPSVASLKSLRQFAKASKALQPFVGFGNPLLTGPSGADKTAWARQNCQPGEPVRVASRSVRGKTSRFFRGNLADVELIRSQAPLPETADELCAVARSAGAQESAVHLGDKATETTIKALSASGALAQSRVVHFATHGLLASETGMVTDSKAEPSLILTPPEQPTEDDDGLLTASEVAQLKLDADWVVLSACNTAAGGSDDLNAEALSGLARAFFYAGARALLVSHWAVDSHATVSLVTRAFEELKADAKVGRAEALRRSMLALIGSGGRNAHPATWSPFVVVGEGAGAR